MSPADDLRAALTARHSRLHRCARIIDGRFKEAVYGGSVGVKCDVMVALALSQPEPPEPSGGESPECACSDQRAPKSMSACPTCFHMQHPAHPICGVRLVLPTPSLRRTP